MTIPLDLLDLVPDPAEVHRRLVQATRAERLLRQLLRLALAAREERRRDNNNAPPAKEVARG